MTAQKPHQPPKPPKPPNPSKAALEAADTDTDTAAAAAISDFGPRGESLWSKGIRKFYRDRMGMLGLAVVCGYFVIALGVLMGLWGQQWDLLLARGYTGMSAEHWFGTNINGQDIFQRVLFGTKTAFEIGVVVSLGSVVIGGILGGLAGFWSGTWVDQVIMWLYGCVEAIPYLLFIFALAFAFRGTVLEPHGMHIALIATFWASTARIVRGEVIKIKHLDYVEAAHAVGVRPLRILFKHIIPNTSHILLVKMTLDFVSAIKAEVILSFLGLGIKDGVSWGLMIAESTTEVTAGHFNNFLAASIFLFVLVMAFNVFSDAMQDALDPKKVM